jgi:hypothetical protein
MCLTIERFGLVENEMLRFSLAHLLWIGVIVHMERGEPERLAPD